jgi:ADP-ribose pyrophosphatase YjhB (NUDIX family)
MKLTRHQKETIARIVRQPLVYKLLRLSLRAIAPRHRCGVGIVAFDADERILMLRHVFHPKAPWGLPGGIMERREAPEACARRELWEETGLEAELGPVVLAYREPNLDHIGLVYTARILPGPIELSSEIIEARWYHPAELPVQLRPYDRKGIGAALEHNGLLTPKWSGVSE